LRLHHFETLGPVCPVCRTAVDSFPLAIARVDRDAGGHLLQAILHCTNPQCLREYPVIDGIPLLLANLRQFIAENALRLLRRRDLSPALESLIGDCCGPGSDFDAVRQQVSAYTWEHYGDFDPEEREAGDGPRPGAMLAALVAGMELADPVPEGPILEVGCGPGRGSFALANRTDQTVLGVDLHFPMLGIAAGVLRDGALRYDRRRVGLVYDRREFAIPLPDGTERVDFWLCDATALPFREGTFSLVVGLNVLDSIYAPRELLRSIAGVLGGGGKVVLTAPYDWSSGATPLEGWLGGHSQRSPAKGSSEEALRSLLTPDGSGSQIPDLTLTAERDGLPWQVRLHDRATMRYLLHLIVAARSADPPLQQ
jgi:SAM-dependent methyltransferase/uncharacterized protein YbaR (Trm112 family)